jgi:hypothetical protein
MVLGFIGAYLMEEGVTGLPGAGLALFPGACRTPRIISTVGVDNFNFYHCSESNGSAAFARGRVSCPGRAIALADGKIVLQPASDNPQSALVQTPYIQSK